MFTHPEKVNDFDLLTSIKNWRNTRSYYSSAYTVVQEPEIVRRTKIKRMQKLEEIHSADKRSAHHLSKKNSVAKFSW